MSNYGWTCPKCGNVYSPNTAECYRCNRTEHNITTSTDVALNDYYKHQRDMEVKYCEKNDN